MPSKKELQEQIEELRKELRLFKDRIDNQPPENSVYFNDIQSLCISKRDLRLLKKSKNYNMYFWDWIVDTVELRKQFLALLDYLKLEYKVEDKHLEGFKKK